MRILQVSPSYYPATYFGGSIFATMGLCDALARQDNVSLRVLTTDTAGPNRKDRLVTSGFPVVFSEGYDVYYCRKLLGKDISYEMFSHLMAMVSWAEVVHLTGVYSPPTIPTLLACRILGRPVVLSPHGSLQRWSGSSKIGVKSGWEKVCNSLLERGRAVLHVTSREEAMDSAARMPRAEVVLIPNGVNVPEIDSVRQWLPGGVLRMLYMGRLHPIKGIENLLTAIATPDLGEVTLKICGEGDPEYRAELERQVVELALGQRVVFAGHVSGDAKRVAYMEADVCLIPSYSENFGMVVAEALSYGVPVVVSKGAPWADVETYGCGLWVENSPEKLACAMKEIRKMDLAEMGGRGRSWMKCEFSWDILAQRMMSVYSTLAK